MDFNHPHLRFLFNSNYHFSYIQIFAAYIQDQKLRQSFIKLHRYKNDVFASMWNRLMIKSYGIWQSNRRIRMGLVLILLFGRLVSQDGRTVYKTGSPTTLQHEWKFSHSNGNDWASICSNSYKRFLFYALNYYNPKLKTQVFETNLFQIF